MTRFWIGIRVKESYLKFWKECSVSRTSCVFRSTYKNYNVNIEKRIKSNLFSEYRVSASIDHLSIRLKKEDKISYPTNIFVLVFYFKGTVVWILNDPKINGFSFSKKVRLIPFFLSQKYALWMFSIKWFADY